MYDAVIDDARASDPVERLLEDSWESRSRSVTRRELLTESLAGLLFLSCAVPLALAALAGPSVDATLVVTLVLLYAVVSRIEFAVGAGYVVPSYLLLVPMLLLLPPGLVPLLTAAGLVLGALGQWLARRSGPERLLFSVPDAWHAVGPALVLLAAGPLHGTAQTMAVYLAAFVAGCVFDLVSSTLREAAALGIAPRVQVRVMGVAWVADACLAPVGFLLADAARGDTPDLLLVLPIAALLVLFARDRSARIAEAQRRLELVARERTRLQGAVRRLGDAFAAKLDLEALADLVLRGSIEAVDAEGGSLVLDAPRHPIALEVPAQERTAGDGAWRSLEVPFRFAAEGEDVCGALTVVRRDRAFREDEEQLLAVLVERAEHAAGEIVAHEAIREQAVTDPLTRLGNRRRLAADLAARLGAASEEDPFVLMLFDLDGFKDYNDTFGHLAGDQLLSRLGGKLAAAVADHGAAYRLGGDEFCALLAIAPDELGEVVTAAADALAETGSNFDVASSYGAVLLPHEATSPDYALQLADERMYALKQSRSAGSRDQTREVLMRIMQAREPRLADEQSAGNLAELVTQVGNRMGMTAEQLDELSRAAELHDVGKVGVPDAILDKPGELDADEWEFIRRHTVLGERILSAAPALRPVAAIVRASHERWDGQGYPDALAGEAIPLGARIIAVCDAYEAMLTERSYRSAMSRSRARDELRREAGRQFDPAVVKAFLETFDERTEERPQPVAIPHAQSPADVAAHLRAVLARSQA